MTTACITVSPVIYKKNEIDGPHHQESIEANNQEVTRNDNDGTKDVLWLCTNTYFDYIAQFG